MKLHLVIIGQVVLFSTMFAALEESSNSPTLDTTSGSSQASESTTTVPNKSKKSSELPSSSKPLQPTMPTKVKLRPQNASNSNGQKEAEKGSFNKATKTKASSQKGDKKSEKKLPVTFTSETLSGSQPSGVIYLEEAVRIEKGSMFMRADKATIFFKKDRETIDWIEGIGNIFMQREDKEKKEIIQATGEKVTYYPETEIATLQGNAHVTKGTESIKGTTIIYNIKDGTFRATKVKGKISQ